MGNDYIEFKDVSLGNKLPKIHSLCINYSTNRISYKTEYVPTEKEKAAMQRYFHAEWGLVDNNANLSRQDEEGDEPSWT